MVFCLDQSENNLPLYSSVVVI